MRLEITLARISSLVGSGRVGQAVLTDDHRTASFRMERFVVADSSPHNARSRQRTPTRTRERSPIRTGIALRRLRPAAYAQVTHADGRPYLLHLQTSALPSTLKIQRAYGPWRRSGQWWSSDVWSYEEWDIDAEANDGTRLLALLTNNRLHHQWQLEALYD